MKVGKYLFVVIQVVALFGCGMDKKPNLNNPEQKSSSISTLSIKPEDWVIESTQNNGTEISTRKLKAEKLEFVKRNFKAPTLSPITVPESNGFEVYRIRGYEDLEASVYIQPKIYINSSSREGSILGYKTGTKDDHGNELVEISVPVALVNGLVPAIPSVANSTSDKGAAIPLPAQYVIPDVNALKNSVGKKVETLPVCPELFKLVFENKEYWATSPFSGLSACPLNQFFRIKFQASVEEMGRMLEAAAIKTESVTLITDLSVIIDVPKVIVQVQTSPDSFQKSLSNRLKGVTPIEAKNGKPAYLLSDIEELVSASLMDLAKSMSLKPIYSGDILSQGTRLTLKYFNAPMTCSNQGSCATLRASPLQLQPINFSWMESELLVAPLQTQTMTTLGAVANASSYISFPSRDQLSQVRRPEFFKGLNFSEIIRVCTQLSVSNWPEKLGDLKVYYGSSTSDQDYFKEYCRQIAYNGSIDTGDRNQFDGYYPLGKNTVVYPGAWLKIDVNSIEELTTARTRTDKTGQTVVESEIVDVLATDPNARITQCLEGENLACADYEKLRVTYKDSSGFPTQGPCQKGSADCVCIVKDNQEICTRGWFEALDYDCDPKDRRSYCPYWRTQKDTVDYEIEYDCKDVKTASNTSFLCIGGCSENHGLVCQEKSRKPIQVERQHLNCQEDDPSAGTAHREEYCVAPQYKCRKWTSNCKRYSVNQSFRIIHENVAPKWRQFNIDKGELPKRFWQDIYLKFVSPGSVVTNCNLDQFPRVYKGDSIYIKLPSGNEGFNLCDKPLWNEINTNPLYYPKVYIKNAISYDERRLCGTTEYSLTTDEVPFLGGSKLVPSQFSYKTVPHIGPVDGTCRAEKPFRIGDDLWFTERPPIRFSGSVSVLGKMLESIVTEVKP